MVFIYCIKSAHILTQKTLSQTCSVFITHFFIYCLTQYSFYIKWTFRWMFTCMLTKIEGNACSLNSRNKFISSIHNSVTTNVVSSVKAASYSLFCDFIISILESFWSPQRDTESRKLLSVFVQKMTKYKHWLWVSAQKITKYKQWLVFWSKKWLSPQ